MRDCVVIGLDRNGNAEACAMLLLRDSSDSAAEEIVDRANSRLAPFQRMRRWIVWPENGFPANPDAKTNLGAIRRAAANHFGGGEHSAAVAHRPRTAIARAAFSSDSRCGSLPKVPIGKLQLSSIERVELLSALEDRYQLDLERDRIRPRRYDAAPLLDCSIQPTEKAVTYHYPRWAQSLPMRILRARHSELLARPAMLLLGWPRISRTRQSARREMRRFWLSPITLHFLIRLILTKRYLRIFAESWPWRWMASFSNRCATHP